MANEDRDYPHYTREKGAALIATYGGPQIKEALVRVWPGRSFDSQGTLSQVDEIGGWDMLLADLAQNATPLTAHDIARGNTIRPPKPVKAKVAEPVKAKPPEPTPEAVEIPGPVPRDNIAPPVPAPIPVATKPEAPVLDEDGLEPVKPPVIDPAKDPNAYFAAIMARRKREGYYKAQNVQARREAEGDYSPGMKPAADLSGIFDPPQERNWGLGMAPRMTGLYPQSSPAPTQPITRTRLMPPPVEQAPPPDPLPELPPSPEFEMAQSFALALTGALEGVIRLRYLHDKDKKHPSQEREGTLKELWHDLLTLQALGYGVFYFLNEITPGLTGFATDEDVTAIRFLGIDADEGLPVEFHAPPNLVIKTSTKDDVARGQILWRVPPGAIAVSDFKAMQQSLADTYHTDRAVSNPSRIFRLPGTLHQKREPSLVTFTSGIPEADHGSK